VCLKQLLLATVKHQILPTYCSKDPNAPARYDRGPKVSSLALVGRDKGPASNLHPSDPSCSSGEAAGWGRKKKLKSFPEPKVWSCLFSLWKCIYCRRQRLACLT